MKVTRLAGGPNRQLGLWTIENAELRGEYYPSVCIKTDSEVFVPYNERTMSLGTDVFVLPNMDAVEISSRISDPVFFFVYNTDNYFHYIYDSITILHTFFELRTQYPTLKLLMKPAHKYPYIMDCLRSLGLSDADIITAEPGQVYSTLWVSSSLTHDGQSNEPPHPNIWSLYSRMSGTATNTPKKFYVSRRSWKHGDTTNMGTNYTTRRKMMVEDQLVAELEKIGYVEVFCELLSMTEKIAYFANATHVVGAIGGGMCNLVFAKPSCIVTSINSPEFAEINKRFLYSMNHTRLTQYTNTRVVSSLYRRVRANGKIGEVTAVDGEKLTIAVSDGVGWTLGEAYETMTVNEKDVNFLDNGLNSPWTFDITDFMKQVNACCFIGNSHVDQFNIDSFLSNTSGRIDKLYCMGASIKGLANPNSVLQLKPMILDYQSKNPSSRLMFFLGQVDIEFGYYFKCVKDNVKHDIHEYIDNLVVLYEKFLASEITNTFYVLGINPSVIRDIRHNYIVSFECPNGINGFYSEVGHGIQFKDVEHIYNDSLETRCSYTKIFNQSLADMCRRRNFNFIDISPVLLEEGVLKSKYVPAGDREHHLKIPDDFELINFVLSKTY